MSVLRVENLSASILNGPAIVDGISFHMDEGETLALLGESGCGKSMTALSLMKLLPAGIATTGGHAWLDGADILSFPEMDMRTVRGGKIGMIFQEPGLSLNPVMTVGEQISEVLALHQGVNRSAAGKYAAGLLRQVGIPDPGQRLNEYSFQLSGGMKQRVMIAMALAGRPRLLIADEPTTALDVTIQAQVLQLLRETQAAQGMAMLLITHDLGVVSQTAHHVAVMYAGQIVEMTTRDALFASPRHPYTQKLFAALPEMSGRHARLAAIPGSVPALGDTGSGCRFAARCSQVMDVCHEIPPPWLASGEIAGVRCHLYSSGNKENAREARLDKPETVIAIPNAADGSAAPMLQVENLKVHFPIRKGMMRRVAGHVKAVDDVTFSISRGRTVALVGESGCGKTTVGKAVLQLIRANAGSVKFRGHELCSLSPEALKSYRGGIQMVFQDPYASLNPKMRIAEILMEGMDSLGIEVAGQTRDQYLDELLERVGLPASARWRYPHEFSGGQRQRIAIARALAVKPEVLICDEPTSALDVSVQAQILNLIKDIQINAGLGYLFITHNLSVVEYIAHEVCVMYLGRIVERGSVEEVMQQPAHPYTRALLSAVPRVNEVSGKYVKLAGEMPSPANPPQGCHFHNRCSQAMDKCRQVYPESRKIGSSHFVSCHL